MTITFGTHLRATRLRWHWWEKRGVYVRITPKDKCIVVEVAAAFSALSERPPGLLHSVIQDFALLDLCEPLQAEFTREYQCWEVDDCGKVIP